MIQLFKSGCGYWLLLVFVFLHIFCSVHLVDSASLANFVLDICEEQGVNKYSVKHTVLGVQ